MAVYRNKDSLLGKTLRLNDTIIFNIIGQFECKYNVCNNYLYRSDAFNNDYIFSVLKIIDKIEFASKAYGYKPYSGVFPTCECDDYEALTRITISLFEEIEKKQEIYNKETKKEELIKIKTMATTETKKGSIFNSFIEKYKAQFIPEKDNSLRISMDGNICVPVGDGEYVGIDKNNNLISYPEDVCLEMPIYVISKSFVQVKEGDIILLNKTYAKVLKKGDKEIVNCLTFTGYSKNKKEIKDFVLGQSYVKVVVNMFDNMNLEQFNPMMLALSNDDMNIRDFLMIQMLQKQDNEQKGQFNPMLMMMLSDKKDNSSIFEMMIIMQMMGGKMPNLFSTNDNE